MEEVTSDRSLVPGGGECAMCPGAEEARVGHPHLPEGDGLAQKVVSNPQGLWGVSVSHLT